MLGRARGVTSVLSSRAFGAARQGSPYFDPSSTIFNADNVTGSMIHVTDDPLRVLVAQQHGVTNVVALLALTPRSFALLAEFMAEIGAQKAEWL